MKQLWIPLSAQKRMVTVGEPFHRNADDTSPRNLVTQNYRKFPIWLWFINENIRRLYRKRRLERMRHSHKEKMLGGPAICNEVLYAVTCSLRRWCRIRSLVCFDSHWEELCGMIPACPKWPNLVCEICCSKYPLKEPSKWNLIRHEKVDLNSFMRSFARLWRVG